jgi:hypothetical protein
MADTRRNLHQVLKGKQLSNALYGVYKEVLQDLTEVLKESAAKKETAKTTITAPPSTEEFHKQRRQKWKPIEDAGKRVKKHTTSTTGLNDPKLQSKPEAPTQNFFAPLRSTDMKADHRNNADDTTEHSQGGRPPPIVLTSQVNLIQLQRQLKGLLKNNLSFITPETSPELSRRKRQILQPLT